LLALSNGDRHGKWEGACRNWQLMLRRQNPSCRTALWRGVLKNITNKIPKETGLLRLLLYLLSLMLGLLLLLGLSLLLSLL
jgi:hypothetical protein